MRCWRSARAGRGAVARSTASVRDAASPSGPVTLRCRLSSDLEAPNGLLDPQLACQVLGREELLMVMVRAPRRQAVRVVADDQQCAAGAHRGGGELQRLLPRHQGGMQELGRDQVELPVRDPRGKVLLHPFDGGGLALFRGVGRPRVQARRRRRPGRSPPSRGRRAKWRPRLRRSPGPTPRREAVAPPPRRAADLAARSTSWCGCCTFHPTSGPRCRVPHDRRGHGHGCVLSWFPLVVMVRRCPPVSAHHGPPARISGQ